MVFYVIMNQKMEGIITKVIFAILALALWEIVAKSGVFGEKSELVFPSLEAIGSAFIRNFTVGYADISLPWFNIC